MHGMGKNTYFFFGTGISCAFFDLGGIGNVRFKIPSRVLKLADNVQQWFQKNCQNFKYLRRFQCFSTPFLDSRDDSSIVNPFQNISTATNKRCSLKKWKWGRWHRTFWQNRGPWECVFCCSLRRSHHRSLTHFHHWPSHLLAYFFFNKVPESFAQQNSKTIKKKTR